MCTHTDNSGITWFQIVSFVIALLSLALGIFTQILLYRRREEDINMNNLTELRNNVMSELYTSVIEYIKENSELIKKARACVESKSATDTLFQEYYLSQESYRIKLAIVTMLSPEMHQEIMSEMSNYDDQVSLILNNIDKQKNQYFEKSKIKEQEIVTHLYKKIGQIRIKYSVKYLLNQKST
ncbi:MAG: hypothetical protein U0Y96_10195 [Candidatus Kapaibacterium sp.]